MNKNVRPVSTLFSGVPGRGRGSTSARVRLITESKPLHTHASTP